MNDFLMAAASATADAPEPATLGVLEKAGLGPALADAGLTPALDESSTALAGIGPVTLAEAGVDPAVLAEAGIDPATLAEVGLGPVDAGIDSSALTGAGAGPADTGIAPAQADAGLDTNVFDPQAFLEQAAALSQAHAAAMTHAHAEVPPQNTRTSLAREGGPLDSIIPDSTDNFGALEPREEVDR